MSRLNNNNSSSTFGNKETHIFTEFGTMSKETTQKEILETIKNINVDGGTFQASDTTTHEKLETINTTLTDGINVNVADIIVLTESSDIASKNALVTASAIYGYNPNGGVVENITFSNSTYTQAEGAKNRLDTSSCIIDQTTNNTTRIEPINTVLLNGVNGLICSSVLMGTNENNQSSRLLMTNDNILKVQSSLVSEVGDTLTAAELAVDRFGLDTLSVIYYRDDNSILQEMKNTGGALNVYVDNELTIESGNVAVTGTVTADCTGTMTIQGNDGTAVPKTLSCDTDGKLNVNATFGSASILVQGSDYEADPTNRDLYVDANGYTTTNVITNAHENILVGWDELGSKLTQLSTGSTVWSTTNPWSTEQDGWVVSVPVTTGPTSSASLMWYNSINWGTINYNPQYSFTFADIDIFYMIISNYNSSTTNNFPRLRIYSAPTGSGDALPGYYKSRWEYVINTSQFTNNGSNIMIYNGNLARVKANDTECPRVAYILNNTQGPHANTEIITHIELFSEPSSTPNQHNVIEGAIYVKNKGLINYYFTNNNKSKAEIASQKLSSLAFTTGSLDVNLKNVAVTSVPVEIKTTGNTIKIDSSNNTIKIGQGTTDNNIKITDGTDVATVTLALNETAIKGLDTNAYLLVKNLTAGINTYLTSSIPTNTEFFQSQALDVNVTNHTTTNDKFSFTNNNGKGLNMYQIMPKIKNITMYGYNNTANANLFLAGTFNTMTLTSFTSFWGKANTKTFYLYTSGTAARTIKYYYIDANGDEKTDTATGVANGYVLLKSNIVGVNSFEYTGGNAVFDNNDSSHIVIGNTSTYTTAVCSKYNWRQDLQNCIYTVPNGCIALVNTIDGAVNIANDIFNLNVWDVNGNRSVVWSGYFYAATTSNARTAGGGEYGCFGRIFTAGETITFTNQVSTATGRFVVANIKLVYLN